MSNVQSLITAPTPHLLPGTFGASEPSPPPTHRWWLLLTVAAGLLLVTLDNSILYTALPTLADELGATPGEALWIINIYPLVMAGLLLGAGTLGDRVGHRRMFLTGLCLFGAASLFAAFASSAAMLIIARACLAIGAAAMMPATLALIGLSFHDERERNLAIAVWGSLALVGAAIGPIVGGTLLAHFWWGSVFLINVPVVILAIIGALVFAPAGGRDASRPWDLASSLLALVALSGLVIAIKSLIGAPSSWLLGSIGLAAFAVAGAVFCRRQQRLPHPLLDVAIFRHRAFLSGTVSAIVTLFAIAGLQLATTQRFQLVDAFTPLQAGLLVSVVALGCLPSALLGGLLLHRIGLRPLIAGGLGVGALGVMIMLASMGQPLLWLIVGLFVTGLGLGAAISVASTAIIGSVPRHRVGMASSVEEVSYEFGALFAVAVLGSLMAALYTSAVGAIDAMPVAAKAGFAQASTLLAEMPTAEWAAAATAAYERSYIIVLAIIAVVLLAGAIATHHLLRRMRPGTTDAHHSDVRADENQQPQQDPGCRRPCHQP